ncbi:MAG: helix-turn-helix domain-containing protein [Spirochaetaceae bacterium]|nr:helix-turn-helix domain-containing protein [Spirochaetaceae bacterium]
MESYGSLLKTARENKEMTILDVERDTAITRQYIEAMEEEDTAVFPGEAYLIGFLHNYAEFLGLNGDMIVSLYKNKKLQESPIPDGLVPKHRPVWIIPLVSLLILAGLGGIVFGTVKLVGFITMLQAQKAEAAEETQRFHTYTLSEKPLQRRIYKGDHILVPQSEGNIDLAVANTLGLLQLETPAGLQVIDLSDEVELDIDNDGVPDMIVYVSDVSNTDSDRGAEVRMLLKTGSAVGITNLDEIQSADELPTNATQFEILTDNRAYPFTINASFRANCLFRYRIDRKEPIEDYYSSGQVVTITSQNGTRLWMSNGNVVKLQVIANGRSYELEPVKAGQVQTEDVKWVKMSDGRYRLVVVEID